MQAAESVYLEAIRSGDTLGWRNYVLFLLEENRLKDAEAQLKVLARRHPDVGERPLADLLALQGRWGVASNTYRRLVARGSEVPLAIRQAVRRHEQIPRETIRRSLRRSGSAVLEALEYTRTAKS